MKISEAEKNEKKDALERMLLTHVGSKRVTRDEIMVDAMAIAALAMFSGLTESDIEHVAASVETKVNLIVGEDVVLVAPGFKPWLDAERKAEISWKRWNAYEAMLKEKAFSPVVIDRMNDRSHTILELAGDPTQAGSWAKRGLVIGDVQSGKTANYLGLFNKAADAGYKIIILFGGHTDKLRQQTQERVDEGFIGKNSSLTSKPGEFSTNAFGVGKQPNFEHATGLTTWFSDFSVSQVRGSSLAVAALNGPVIFVIKKNKKIIENLIAWLRGQGKDGENTLEFPMLLLDDEADYASINTNKPDDDPTKINQAIRDLLSVFRRNSYVGFTATPFANVFIDPEAEADLFPRDYIFSLESPSTYFGPEKMVESDESEPNFQTFMTDAVAWLPYSHKSGAALAALPQSLKDAVATFFLSNAVRDLRGDLVEPRTMMINASRFKSVQRKITSDVEEFVSDLRAELKHSVPEGAWDRMRQLFETEYTHISESWDEVSETLVASIEHVKVVLANSDTSKSGVWEAVFRSDRARVIAVGGDVLSRGLTLPGLVVSYFHRRSVAYDTLMQMGRWFGYRNGYEDICKLWIDTEISDWYKFIHAATTELRAQVQLMRKLGQTPRDFGLKVRRHPGAALVATALNKRRNSDVAHKISLRDNSFESVRLSSEKAKIDGNLSAAKTLIGSAGPANLLEGQTSIWQSVPSQKVLNFFQNFETSEAELVFADKLIERHLQATRAPWMETWTVILMSGSSEMVAFDAMPDVKAVRRAMYVKGQVVYAGGRNLRLGGKGDEGLALSTELRAKAKNDALPKTDASDVHYRQYLDKPLLIIYPVDPSLPKDSIETLPQRHKDAGFQRYMPQNPGEILIGVHVAIPRGDADFGDDSELVSWLVNRTWMENNSLLQGADTEDEDE
jgi:hypothetical protein